MDQLPIFVVFGLVALLLFLAIELGYPIGRWYRKEEGLEKYPLESAANTSIFGLVAFFLAFSFGVSAGKYGELRDLVRQDIEAIEDVYKTASFLPDDQAEAVRELLREYHGMRMDAIATRDMGEVQKAIARSVEIQAEIWDIAVATRKANESSILNQFVSAARKLADAHNVRVNKALLTRLPTATWFILGLMLFLAHLMMGFTSGLHGRRSRLAFSISILAFSSMVILVIDLDRPIRSLFSRGPNPMGLELLEQMRADAAE